MTADALSHKFRRLGRSLVESRIRRCTVSDTGWRRIWLTKGNLLKAQARLGHSDPSTTLRHYSHATPLDDEDIADELDALLSGE